ncbi:hypothetical protein [Desulfobotulus alkaliphilus]|uniref:hypothetical protein n=1 Tax=Desulfobotulus alkaliphilus TaxID=622671 RepID=UPI0011A5B72D|nr:hypothetical protein [Desulfobotulus alkaliphilus]
MGAYGEKAGDLPFPSCQAGGAFIKRKKGLQILRKNASFILPWKKTMVGITTPQLSACAPMSEMNAGAFFMVSFILFMAGLCGPFSEGPVAYRLW